MTIAKLAALRRVQIDAFNARTEARDDLSDEVSNALAKRTFYKTERKMTRVEIVTKQDALAAIDAM